MDVVAYLPNLDLFAFFCLFFGLAFVIFEMFTPGFGFPGTLGVILLVWGVARAARSVTEVLVLTGVILAILAVALLVVLRSASKGRLAKNLILGDTFKKEHGYTGTEDLRGFLNKSGITLTVLRPAGAAEIDGIKLDVVSESEFIPKGTKVKVVKVEGNKVVVRSVDM